MWVGVDVGGERAATAVVWLNDRLHVGCEIFHGDGGVLEAKALVEELAAKYRIVEVVFDPWRFGQTAQELSQRGIKVVEFPQSDSRMCPTSERLYRAVVEARLCLPDHETLRQHSANATAHTPAAPGGSTHQDATSTSTRSSRSRWHSTRSRTSRRPSSSSAGCEPPLSPLPARDPIRQLLLRVSQHNPSRLRRAAPATSTANDRSATVVLDLRQYRRLDRRPHDAHRGRRSFSQCAPCPLPKLQFRRGDTATPY
jgi:hypothetical protein